MENTTDIITHIPHADLEIPIDQLLEPAVWDTFEVARSLKNALPIPGTQVIRVFHLGASLWIRYAKVVCRLPNGSRMDYFLKVSSLGERSRYWSGGEFESLKAMRAVSPIFAPEVYAWGEYSGLYGWGTCFLLAEFRNIGRQPLNPVTFTARLAELHKNSVSPTGKFGFHTTTCHGSFEQVTNCWEESWAVLFQKQLGHVIKLYLKKNEAPPEFKFICDLLVEKVVPRLLEPLQSEGRSIKPCLIHGNLWDDNVATDMNTGEPFVFGAGSMYAHNEYEIGNWRAPRHYFSFEAYISNYKRKFPVSEPGGEWDARNLLYSLRYEFVVMNDYPRFNLRSSVYYGMRKLCRMYFPKEVHEFDLTLTE